MRVPLLPSKNPDGVVRGAPCLRADAWLRRTTHPRAARLWCAGSNRGRGSQQQGDRSIGNTSGSLRRRSRPGALSRKRRSRSRRLRRAMRRRCAGRADRAHVMVAGASTANSSGSTCPRHRTPARCGPRRFPALGSAGPASRAEHHAGESPRARDISAPSSRARRARAGRVCSPVAGSTSPRQRDVDVPFRLQVGLEAEQELRRVGG